MVYLKCSKDIENSHNKSRVSSSSSMLLQWSPNHQGILFLKSIDCFVMVFDSTILNRYSCSFRNGLWAIDLVIYNDSNLSHISVVIASRANNELNQLKNSSRLDSVINSLNLVHEPNEFNLSWKLSSLNKYVELILKEMLFLIFFVIFFINTY